MRVLHVDYLQLRRYGHTRVSWAFKLHSGLIMNNHLVQGFSDRDVAAFEAPFGIRDLGKKKANQRLLETAEAFHPDLMILGHCDIITNQTVRSIQQLFPALKVAYCNNDPLFVPENVQRIHHRCKVADAVFVSTGRPELKIFEGSQKRLYHMPNPVDPAVECFDNSRKVDFQTDLLFCGNSENYTNRLKTVECLKQQLSDELRFSTYGCLGVPPVWGYDYDQALKAAKMGLNLSRQTGHYWYSSARMAQLGGNGILQFTHRSHRFDELFPAETIAYFDSEADLLKSIREFHRDDHKRQAWAGKARHFFHEEMNISLYAQHIVESAMEIPYSHDYVWERKP